MVGGADGGNPRGLLHELKVLGVVEIEDQRQGNQEAHEGRDVGPQFDGARIRRGNEQQHQKANQRREQDDREDRFRAAACQSSSSWYHQRIRGGFVGEGKGSREIEVVRGGPGVGGRKRLPHKVGKWQKRGNLGLALLAAGASRTYHRAFPAATGLSGTSGALGSLAGNPVPSDSCIGRRAYPPLLLNTMLFDTRLSRP